MSAEVLCEGGPISQADLIVAKNNFFCQEKCLLQKWHFGLINQQKSISTKH
jgi:hypothetical protein